MIINEIFQSSKALEILSRTGTRVVFDKRILCFYTKFANDS